MKTPVSSMEKLAVSIEALNMIRCESINAEFIAEKALDDIALIIEPRTKAADVIKADHVCDLLNQRFGYRYALELILQADGYSPEQIEIMLAKFRDRNFSDLTQRPRRLARITSTLAPSQTPPQTKDTQ